MAEIYFLTKTSKQPYSLISRQKKHSLFSSNLTIGVSACFTWSTTNRSITKNIKYFSVEPFSEVRNWLRHILHSFMSWILYIASSLGVASDEIHGSNLKDYKSNNTTQHETTRVKHDTTWYNTSTTWDNTSMIRRNTSPTQPNTSTKEAQAAKIGLYFALLLLNYIFSEFLLQIVNIILHVILFQPFEYQGL